MPLTSLLSQAYVAWTIEFDNRWEARLQKAGWAPRFLVSYAMWANFMRFVGDGIAVDELEERCGVWNGPIHRGRMEEWWGYVITEQDVVRAGPAGDLACKKWAGLSAEVDDQWLQRLGEARFGQLVNSLREIDDAWALELPDSMPVLDYGNPYLTPTPEGGPGPRQGPGDQHLGALLARVLLAATLEIEAEAPVSLPMAAGIMRVIDDDFQLVKELPLHAGITKEAITPAVNKLSKLGLAVTEGTGAKMLVRLSAEGRAASDAVDERIQTVEQRWRSELGDVVDDLRTSLEQLAEPAGGPVLAAGLVPPDGCWRGTKKYRAQTEAFLADPRASLPHHPMLTHRGGWPDGA